MEDGTNLEQNNFTKLLRITILSIFILIYEFVCDFHTKTCNETGLLLSAIVCVIAHRAHS
jgi:hypothetical protein